jgi:hypothetical protein
MTEQDGWIEWHGGECPVADDALINVKFRDGGEPRTPLTSPQGLTWQHAPHSGILTPLADIIAYRVVKS